MEAVSVVLLLATLGFAVARPRGWSEVLVAAPAAVLVIVIGAVSASDAWAETRRLLPVIGFLAAVLVLAKLCDEDGLFVAAGAAVARACHGSPVRLLGGVFAVASVTTAVLSLDATVVLLTPVVFATAARLGARSRPHVYACAHLANTGSLLLPVSNLTNLLAFAASGVSLLRFAELMAVPWVLVIAVEFVLFRLFFRSDLDSPIRPAPPVDAPRVPRVTLAILVATLGGFAATSFAGVSPAWAAAGGALLMAARALITRRSSVQRVVVAADPLFCLFVLALGIVVQAVVQNGLGDALDTALPNGASLAALLGVAALAAVLANVINNLPAVLALAPIASAGGTGPVLAVLIGVNLGPNLTYVGSLATLLWRRIARAHDAEPSVGEFTALGVATVPVTLVVATVALWVMLRATGS